MWVMTSVQTLGYLRLHELALGQSKPLTNGLALETRSCEKHRSMVGEMAEWFNAHAWRA